MTLRLLLRAATALGLLLAPARAARCQDLVLPTSLDVTAINGQGVGADGPVITTSETVAAGFSTDASSGFTWVVQPNGIAGGNIMFPGGESVLVHLNPAARNRPVDIQLCMTAIAPASVFDAPNRSFCGTSARVVLDTEGPEVFLAEIEIGGRRQRIDAGPIRINGDFVLSGRVADRFTPPPEVAVRVTMGGREFPATPDASGFFEAAVSVADLDDGDYEVRVVAEDRPTDGSTPNETVAILP